MTFDFFHMKNFAVDDNLVVNLAFFVRCLDHFRRGLEDTGRHRFPFLAFVKGSEGKFENFCFRRFFLRRFFQKSNGFF